MTPKQYYQTYQADDHISDLSIKLIELIINEQPTHVLEFGMGSGKNLHLLSGSCFVTGIDISFVNVIRAHTRNDLQYVIRGDEQILSHLTNFDIVFTVSVLDHIEDISEIIGQLKRIANKAIYLAETNDTPNGFYYPHEYEKFDFVRTGFVWKSDHDGALYEIWKWTPSVNEVVHDDLAH